MADLKDIMRYTLDCYGLGFVPTQTLHSYTLEVSTYVSIPFVVPFCESCGLLSFYKGSIYAWVRAWKFQGDRFQLVGGAHDQFIGIEVRVGVRIHYELDIVPIYTT